VGVGNVGPWDSTSPVEPSGVMIQHPAAAIHPTSFGACGHLALGCWAAGAGGDNLLFTKQCDSLKKMGESWYQKLNINAINWILHTNGMI